MGMVQDCIGTDGLGGLDPQWRTISLAQSCPSLQTFVLILYVNRDSPDHYKRSAAILQWRYALRMLASAPTILKSIVIGLRTMGDVPYEELN